MSVSNLTAAELPEMLARLQQALETHEQWHRELSRTIVCALPPNPDDLATDAHRRCRFGQWYDSALVARVREHPTVAAIGRAHECMHDHAREMLAAGAAGNAVAPRVFDAFADAMQTMRFEIGAFRQELADAFKHADPLTGAATRSGMMVRLREQHAMAQRGIEASCVAMVDLDRFKSVNDRYGHAAGDRVLAAAARCLMEHVRPYDVVYRYGGEEFVILMRHAAPPEAAVVLERIRALLAALPIDIAGRTVHITASFGVAPLDAADGVETAIIRADEAMYAAKQAGRNTVRIWDPSMHRERG